MWTFTALSLVIHPKKSKTLISESRESVSEYKIELTSLPGNINKENHFEKFIGLALPKVE